MELRLSGSSVFRTDIVWIPAFTAAATIIKHHKKSQCCHTTCHKDSVKMGISHHNELHHPSGAAKNFYGFDPVILPKLDSFNKPNPQ